MSFILNASTKETPEQRVHKERYYHLSRARNHFHQAALIAQPGTRTHYSAVSAYHDSKQEHHHHSLTPRTVSSERKKAEGDVERHHKALEKDFPITGEEQRDRQANGAVARGHVRMGKEHAKKAGIRLTPLGID